MLNATTELQPEMKVVRTLVDKNPKIYFSILETNVKRSKRKKRRKNEAISLMS